jgi:hypothetical protein
MSLARQVQVGEKSRLAPVRKEVLSWLVPALKNANPTPLVGLLAQRNG